MIFAMEKKDCERGKLAPACARSHAGRRRGGAFTLVELLITVSILLILVGIVVPTLTPNDRSRLVSAAQLVASDLEFAQSMSVAAPADPAMIRFDPANPAGPTYWVALSSAPETPIIKQFLTNPYLVTMGQGGASELTGVTFTLVGATDRVIFDAFGQLVAPAEVRVRLSNPAGSLDVVISASTGFITIGLITP